jgi:SSS family solute:Na+ symporter
MALTDLPLRIAAVISVTLMCSYVVFGGAWGAEMGGLVKVALLLAMSAVCIVVVMVKSGGPEFMGGTLPLHLSDLFSRGVGKDLSNVTSAILGVLSTQTYAQAVWSAKNYHVARRATLLGCLICLPVGFTGMLIGLSMRGSGLANPAEAFPMFLIENLPPVIGGIGLGALLITVVTGGGGLTLGVSTIFVRDIASRIWPQLNHGKAHINAMRITILVVLTGCAMVAVLLPGALINDLGFLSMGLRGTVVFIPLSLALFAKGRFHYKPVLVSMIAGPAVMLFSNLVWSPMNPLIGSILVCLFICMFGYKSKEGSRL